jgi:hypothetical protein
MAHCIASDPRRRAVPACARRFFALLFIIYLFLTDSTPFVVNFVILTQNPSPSFFFLPILTEGASPGRKSLHFSAPLV